MADEFDFQFFHFIEEKNTYRLEKFTRETQKVEKQKANSSFSRKSEVQKKEKHH